MVREWKPEDGIEARYVEGFDRASKLEKDRSQIYLREGKKMKYKAVRLISLQAVYEWGDKDSMEFREMFEGLFRWCFRQWGMTMQFFAAINFYALGEQLESHTKLRDFLLGGGFIEEVEEPFYSVGDYFRHECGRDYLLALINSEPCMDSLVQLIIPNGKGFYCGAPVEVKNAAEITKGEFAKIVQGNTEFFTKIEEAE